MTDDFALVDFAIVHAPPADVAQALARAAGAQARPGGGAGGGGRRPGLIGRLFGSRGGGAPAEGLAIHPAGHLPPAPLARLMPDDLGFAAGQTPFRVTAPIGPEGLTLVEYREGDGATSPIAAALSKALPGVDVFYFRLSGLRHPGSETVFHIYRDGLAQRRAASVCAEGVASEAEWEVVDTGLPHLVEADNLPPARARAWDVMTPERQGAILMAMGIDPDTLFAPDPDRISLELSAEPGGRAVQEAARIVERARAERARALTTETEARRSAEEAAREQQSPDAAPALAAAATRAATGVVSGPATAQDLPPPALASDDTGTGEPERDERWETEVTRLLVTAVAYALPEAEQVPWLTRLTARLEAGEVEAALAEAQDLIERGDRPAEERRADAERLDALFGVEPFPSGGAPGGSS
jgi:hypothetical protein